MTLPVFLQQIVNGLTIGSLYALVSIGYTMVFGIIRLINFAHGDVFMMAMYFGYFIITLLELPWYVCILFAVALTAALGVLIENCAFRPLRKQHAPSTTLMISAIGVSYLLQNLATVLFSGKQKLFPRIEYFTEVITVGEITFQRMALIVPIVTALLLVALLLFVNKSKVGMAMRAAATDAETANLMGIDVNSIITITFAIGSALAAVGAVFWGSKYLSVSPTGGALPGMKCFICAVIGGIGNIGGAVLGGLLLGMAETMVIAFFPTMTSFKDAISFVFLMVVLLFVPTGLIREKRIDKV